MDKLVRTENPFKFYTRFHLSELTGSKASNLGELLEGIRQVPDSCIYHHTHRFLQQHQYLSPEPPNDFAYWVTDVLGESILGEMLASIDVVQFSTLHDLREKMIELLENYLRENPVAKQKFANYGEQFHFIKSISFIILTPYVAYDLKEFADAIKTITIDSIYFHIFEARLRLEQEINDFSYWLKTSIGEKELADSIVRLDPYTYTMEGLRKTMLKLIENRISVNKY